MTDVSHLQADALALLRRSRAILLDFDGPVCAVFAGVDAANVADQLRDVLRAHGFTPGPENLGPHGVLIYASTLGPDAARAVEDAQSAAEVDAVTSARPAEGATWFLAACLDVHRPVAIVSNNSADAITVYLNQHELASAVTHVVGRDPDDATRMKPNPWTLSRALDQLGKSTSDAVFIGDAVTDIEAAHALGMPSIGYANRPAKVEALRAADAVVTSMLRLGDVMSATGSLR